MIGFEKLNFVASIASRPAIRAIAPKISEKLHQASNLPKNNQTPIDSSNNGNGNRSDASRISIETICPCSV
jgi:hypothetical protein